MSLTGNTKSDKQVPEMWVFAWVTNHKHMTVEHVAVTVIIDCGGRHERYWKECYDREVKRELPKQKERMFMLLIRY